MRLLLLGSVLFLLIGFVAAGTAQACPLCKDAISSPGEGEGEEINKLPLAYNTSIYMMAGMPFLLLGGVGFFIYRGCQRNAEFLGRISQPAAADTKVCPTERIGQTALPE